MALCWISSILVLDNMQESAYLRPPPHFVVSYTWNRVPLNLATLSCFVVYVSVYAAHDNQSREVGPDTLLHTSTHLPQGHVRVLTSLYVGELYACARSEFRYFFLATPSQRSNMQTPI